jgi:hypothetical protein
MVNIESIHNKTIDIGVDASTSQTPFWKGVRAFFFVSSRSGYGGEP